MSFVIFVNGVVLIFFASLMGVDALVFPATEPVFAEACVLMLLPGIGICLSVFRTVSDLRRPHAFLLTSSVWITAAFAGSLPLYLWDLSETDAFFEAMSGITTTGSTILTGLDDMPQGILMWRALLQWIGGVGFIVTGIALLPILKVGGMQLFRTESSDRGEKELTSAARFAGATLWIYLGLSAFCALFYYFGGMSAFDAVTHAMTTLSTGGYSNYDASFGHFQSSFLHVSATIFMLLGALPFAWYIRVALRGRLGSEQVAAFCGMLAVLIPGIALWHMATSDAGFLLSLRDSAFSIVSVVTTTGYATVDYTTWGPAVVAFFFLLTGVGGCTGSTAGGVKIMRWIVFLRSADVELRRIHRPHGIFVARYEHRPIGQDVISGVIAFFSLFAASFASIALALNFVGLDVSTSLSGALTALANVGPGVGAVIGPSGNFSSLPDSAKWILSFGMFLGRLEMLTVYVLVFPRFWRELP